MKKGWIITGSVITALLVGGMVTEGIFLYRTNEKNAQIEKFVEKNYDVNLEDWNGKAVAPNTKELLTALSDTLEGVAGVEVEGDTIKEFFENMTTALTEDTLNTEVHDIYDDTAVVEAYQSGDSSALSEEDKYVLDTATDIIQKLIKEDMTEYEKELAIYNWQVEYVAYDESNFSAIPDDVDEYNYYPYGVLKYHSAICVGNATTFKLFMDLLGIDCKIIHSTENGEHAWNLVCIDGDWYHTDVTFDSASAEGPGYDFFNVPDSVKLAGDYPWNTDDFPAATATKYTYAVKEATEITSSHEIPQLIKDGLDAGKTKLYLKCKTEITNVDSITESISERLGGDTYLYPTNESWMGDYYVIIILMESSDGTVVPNVEDPELDQIIEDLF